MDVSDFDIDGDPNIIVRSDVAGSRNEFAKLWRQDAPDLWADRHLGTNDPGARLIAGDIGADGFIARFHDSLVSR